MAIYHFSAQILSRAPRVQANGRERPGSSAVAAAAYRSGERLTDRGAGQVHDYSRRRGVVHSEIMAPEGSAEWLRDREQLWNAIERGEFRRDAQLAREFNMALPHELSPAQRLQLVREYVGKEFVGRGMVADVALHDPVDDQNRKNFHAHVMVTLRRATATGLDAVKTREWNSRDMLNGWRLEWERACNDALERAGVRVKVDRRTLAAQAKEAEVRREFGRSLVLNRTPEIHVGPRAKRTNRAADVNRVGLLRDLVRHNDRRLKVVLQRMRRRHDLALKRLDGWERSLVCEGKVGNGRHSIGLDRRRSHSLEAPLSSAHRVTRTRRIRQLKAILILIHQVLRSGESQRERHLIRAREVERWLHEALNRGRRGSRSHPRKCSSSYRAHEEYSGVRTHDQSKATAPPGAL